MRQAFKPGGPVATPIRDMLFDKRIEGVIFHCDDPKLAENTRIAAIMLAHRCGYSYKTMVRGNVLTVYRPNVDPFEMRTVIEANRNGGV